MNDDFKKELRDLQVLFVQSQKAADFKQQLFSDCLSGLLISISVLANTLNKVENFDTKDFANSLKQIAKQLSESSISHHDQMSIASNVMFQTASSIEKALSESQEEKKSQAYKDFLLKTDFGDQKLN